MDMMNGTTCQKLRTPSIKLEKKKYLYNHIRMKILNLLHTFLTSMPEISIINTFGNKFAGITKIQPLLAYNELMRIKN